MENTTYTVATATLTESELFQHFLASPMRGHNSMGTNINAEADHYTMIDVLPKSCESSLLDYDIADTFANALMTCEEDPDHEVKMIIWFLEELLVGTAVQNWSTVAAG